jgi:hypothetical protein
MWESHAHLRCKPRGHQRRTCSGLLQHSCAALRLAFNCTVEVASSICHMILESDTVGVFFERTQRSAVHTPPACACLTQVFVSQRLQRTLVHLPASSVQSVAHVPWHPLTSCAHANDRQSSHPSAQTVIKRMVFEPSSLRSTCFCTSCYSKVHMPSK